MQSHLNAKLKPKPGRNLRLQATELLVVARALLSAVSKRIQVVQEQLPAAKAKALLGKNTRCNFCLSCTTFLFVFGFDPNCFVRAFLIRIDV